MLKIEANTESIYNMGGESENFPVGMDQDDNKSQFTSITNQTGVSIRTSKTMQTAYYEITPDTEFIILDLREPEEFQDYHILEGEFLG